MGHELLTLLQKVTHLTQRSNNVFREAASRSLGGAGGFGGESDTCTENPVTSRASILTRACTEDGSTLTDIERSMTEPNSTSVDDEERQTQRRYSGVKPKEAR